MDKISDLIEGAILSGRVRQTVVGTERREVDGSITPYYACRFISRLGHHRLCPMEVAVMEKTQVAGNWHVLDMARELGISEDLAREAITRADYSNDNLIQFFRDRDL